MKTRQSLRTFLLCFILIGILLPTAAHADMLPKPSVQITFEHMGEELCYGTLLSQTPSTIGLFSTWKGSKGSPEYLNGDPIWRAFVDYEDPDGFYYLQTHWTCSEDGTLNWVYYPPETFKILLYYPESDTFRTSGELERFAFDSYFTVDLDQVGDLVARRNYNYLWETAALLCRVALTVLLEVALAWILGFRGKRTYVVLLVVNIITQLDVNLFLKWDNLHLRPMGFIEHMIYYELVIFALEALAYCYFLRHQEKRIKLVGYAFLANLLSFVVGLGLAWFIPGIF